MLWLKERIKNESPKDKIMILNVTLVYFLFAIFLTWYLREIYGWEYGIPGSDLRMYFNGAQALHSGEGIYDLGKIHNALDYSLIHIGYIGYTLFIWLVVFLPTIINIDISLHILYFIQCILGIITALNIADFFAYLKYNKKIRNTLFLVVAFSVALMQMASLLMRDIWIIFFISMLLYESLKKSRSLTKSLLFIIVLFFLRSYTVIITIPVFLCYILDRPKIALWVSCGSFALFFVGQRFIDFFASYSGVLWTYSYSYDLYSAIAFVLSPSPINQAFNVQNMDFSRYALFGGNTEWIYYLLSCWNVYVIPIALLGIWSSVKNKYYSNLGIWGSIIINLSLLYCAFYEGASSARHKLLLLPSFIFFYSNGIAPLDLSQRILYLIFVIIIFVLIFAYTL